MSELDTYGRRILSASPKSPTFIRIHTDKTEMKLRIRVLESLSKREPELLQEMHILKFSGCNYARLPMINGTLTSARPGRGTMSLVSAFVHQSRVFYINRDRESTMILSDSGKFFRTFPSFMMANWEAGRFGRFEGGFISYDETLFFLPEPRRVNQRFYRSLAMLTSDDVFLTYEIMFYELQDDHFVLLMDYMDIDDRMQYMIKSVVMFNNEVLVITGFGADFYNGQRWEKFEMNGLPGRVHENVHPMVRVRHQ